MIWVLVILGLILVGVGAVIGNRRPTKGAPQLDPKGTIDVDPDKPITLDAAFDILAKPMEMGGSQARGRYGSGLLTGLGAGLVIAGLGLAIAPASMLPQRSVAPAPAPGGGVTIAPAPATTPTTPATPSTPATPPAGAVVSFTVNPGDLPSDVAANLQSAGLIADPVAFLARLTERGVDTLLKAGTFSIPTGSSLDQVIDILTA